MIHQLALLCLLLLPMALAVAEQVPDYKGNLHSTGNDDTDQSIRDKNNIRKIEEVQQEAMMEPGNTFMRMKRSSEEMAVKDNASEKNDITNLKKAIQKAMEIKDLKKAIQKAMEIKGCGGTSRDFSEGTIDYPGNGKNYPNNQNCKWEISLGEGDRMEVSFQRFSTYNGRDTLLAINGESGEVIGSYFGRNSVPLPFTTKGNILNLYFTSDRKKTEKGFQLSWKKITETVNQCMSVGGESSILLHKVDSAEIAIITTVNEGNNNVTEAIGIKIGNLEEELQSIKTYQEIAMKNLIDANSILQSEVIYVKSNQEILMNDLTDANSKLDYLITNLDKCPESDGYFYMPPPANQCLKLFRDRPRTRGDAQQLCSDNGLIFPRIYNPIEVRSYIVQRYGGGCCSVWTWLNAQGNGNTIQWGGSGVSIVGSNPFWYPGQPGSHVTPSWCLVLLTDEYNFKNHAGTPFYTVECSSTYYALCEKNLE